MEMMAASNAGSSQGTCRFCPDRGDNVNIAIKQVAWIVWFHSVKKVMFPHTLVYEVCDQNHA